MRALRCPLRPGFLIAIGLGMAATQAQAQQTGAPLPSDPAALALRAKMVQTYRSLRSIRETVVQRQWAATPDKASTIKIELRFRRPNRVYLYVDYLPAGRQMGRWQLVFACDGRSLIFYNSAKNEFQRFKAPATLENLVLPASLREPEIPILLKNSDPFAELEKTALVRYTSSFVNSSDGKQGPSAFDVLLLDVRQGGADRQLRYSLAASDHLLYRWSLAIRPDSGPVSPFQEAETASSVTAEYTQVEANPRLTDADFTFTPPPVAKEISSPRHKR
ncbi:MAG TPA: hypothetical protein VFA07_08280 [Chthonomonadaceae bacterium]|nr:hypothetical protein [Chthonomonadaceae bacterium]